MTNPRGEESQPPETLPKPDDPHLELVWHGLVISITNNQKGGRGLTRQQALKILQPLEPHIERPERPPLGSELIDEVQQHMRECVALGTIALMDAAKVYRDWLTQDVESPNP